MKKNPFEAALKVALGKVPALATVTTPDLPPCPLCNAPAMAGRAYTAWNDIAHYCDCDLNDSPRYDAALQRLWRTELAEERLLETIPSRFRAATLERLRSDKDNGELARQLETWQKGNVYLFGLAGTGKTTMASALARRYAREKKTARFWLTTDLIQAIKESFGEEAPARPVLDHWDVLVLDDIDKVSTSPFVFEVLFNAIDKRWSNEKITIFTSQFDPRRTSRLICSGENERMAEPLESRMAAGMVESVLGPDHRGEGV